MVSDDVRGRLERARLYLLLSKRQCRLPPLQVLAAALDGGCDVVQVREPEMEDGALVSWVREVARITAPRGVPLIVNNRVDVALISGADGVHLGQADLASRDARALAGERLVIGLSTHAAAEIVAAVTLPVDYCGLGPVFDTATKGLAGRGLDLLREALPLARKPTFAIGGITAANVAAVRSAGATRIAVSAAICAAEDPEAAARALRKV